MALERVSNGSYMHPDDPGEPQNGVPRLSVTDEEAAILATYTEGKDVLEIGTGLGVSTRGLASTARAVYTIDIDPWVQENIWPTLPDNVVGAASVEHFGAALVDVAFIDGDHSTEATERDIATAMSMLRPKPGSAILLHDTSATNVRAACKHSGWKYLETTHGVGVLHPYA